VISAASSKGENELRGPLTASAVHLCLDMQNLFAPGAPWAAPWVSHVAPRITELAQRFPERTIFTRFVTPSNPKEMPGRWQSFYNKWCDLTAERIDLSLLDLLPELKRLVPPAVVFDKTRYSALFDRSLIAHLHDRRVDTLIITGSETDVCVLSTVLDAIDLGYRIIVVTDAICSSSDEGHDALLTVYRTRFSEQVETADVETILSAWRR
jgi:nicotinamidase-related amidase